MIVSDMKLQQFEKDIARYFTVYLYSILCYTWMDEKPIYFTGTEEKHGNIQIYYKNISF